MLPRNFETAKLLQMRSEPLGVKQRELSGAQMLYQRHQRDLRCVRYVVEHQFAKKNATDGYAVESTSESCLPSRLRRNARNRADAIACSFQ